MLVGLGVEYQFDAGCRRHQLGRQVILGGTQSAIHDQDARRARGALQRGNQPRPVVPQGHFLCDAMAKCRQRLGDHRGVAVDGVPAHQLVTGEQQMNIVMGHGQ